MGSEADGGVIDKRVKICGTVLRDDKTGAFRMWYGKGAIVVTTWKRWHRR
jgi:hypothetical protein